MSAATCSIGAAPAMTASVWPLNMICISPVFGFLYSCAHKAIGAQS
jgi:hypothetical protein